MPDRILVGKGEAPQHLLFAMANRHGLIAGATGTGKTVSVRVLAEGLAQGGVSVFLADVKGDLSVPFNGSRRSPGMSISSIACAVSRAVSSIRRRDACWGSMPARLSRLEKLLQPLCLNDSITLR
jgi:hypothetical protein